jgi:L-threonylcarbamoyladenylate synthase
MVHSGRSSTAAACRQLAVAVRTLAQGGVVVYPTETLYGLGVDASNPAALHRLVALKGREPGKPILVLVGDMTMLAALVDDIPPAAHRLMRRFWPGPLTVVLRARADVSPVLTGGSGTIGVRLSSHPTARTLPLQLGRPVTAPSANPRGQPPPRTVAEARRYFGRTVDHYVDGGLVQGIPSTVVDARGALRVIRHGAVPATEIRATFAEAE